MEDSKKFVDCNQFCVGYHKSKVKMHRATVNGEYFECEQRFEKQFLLGCNLVSLQPQILASLDNELGNDYDVEIIVFIIHPPKQQNLTPHTCVMILYSTLILRLNYCCLVDKFPKF